MDVSLSGRRVTWANKTVTARGDKTISIIIPVLNEAALLRERLPALRAGLSGEVEIIVVDGGSTDDSREVARLQSTVGSSPAGRGRQLNCGAAQATGQILLFLHADVELPTGWDSGVHDVLADPRVIGGGFLIRADPASVSLNVITCLSNFRSRVRRSFYGDQAIFVRAPAFREIGGFDESLPLFEGYDLTRRLPRVGALACVPRQVRASSRRFIEGGVWRIFMTFHYLKLRYLLGFLPVDTDVLYPIQAGR